jgi:putative hydrolase
VTDNLFDRLRDLLQSTGPVNWRLAKEVAESTAGEPEPVDPWVAEEYEELAHTAALRVSEASPLDPSSGLSVIRVTDQRTWASEAVRGYSFLGEPLAERLAGHEAAGPLGPMMAQLWPALLGMQIGTMTGFMAQRILARFDVGLPPDGPPGPWFVAPNVEEFASDHGLDVRQTRLWVAMHEVIHHAEFGVPWVRDEYASLVGSFVDRLEVDPAVLERRLGALEDPESLERMLTEPGSFTGLLAGPGQAEILDRLRALMAVLEGHAEWLLDKAAPGLVPEAPRLREAIDRRRAEPSQGEQMLQQLIGLELRHHEYRAGTTFCEDVDRRWGGDALARLWEGPEYLPTLAELGDVVGWAARVLL